MRRTQSYSSYKHMVNALERNFCDEQKSLLVDGQLSILQENSSLWLQLRKMPPSSSS